MIPEEELEIDVIRPLDYYRMNLGFPDVLIRVTHIPTRLTAIAGTERSAVRNKELALRGLEAMLANVANRKDRRE